MKAWELRRTGLDGLVLAERPAPVPAGAEVVIGVRAVGLNYRDVAIARGEYPAGRALPLVPGSDVAGVVRAVGPAVRGVRPGDRVVASYVVDWIAGPPEESRTARRLGGPLDGGLAEEVVVPDHAIVPLPDAVAFRAAATLPVAGVTAWRALFESGRLRPGATVLVVGTGGVSTFALQLASAAGARVLVIGGTPAKLERAKALGASAVFSRADDWDRQVLGATEGRGVDLAIDVAGGTTTARLAAVTRVGGAVVLIGFLESRTVTIDLPPILRRSLRLQAVSTGSREDLEALVRVVAGGRLAPVVDRLARFEEAPAALSALATGGHFGKIVVELEP